MKTRRSWIFSFICISVLVFGNQTTFARISGDANISQSYKFPESVSANGSVLTAPKWLEAPALDGLCSDPAYGRAGSIDLEDPDGNIGANVKLLHTGLDMYICFTAIPTSGGEKAVVRVDTDHNRSRQLMPGDYQFSVFADGSFSISQGSQAGLWEPFSIPTADFSAVTATGRSTWDVELRISLEWLSGYARTDGLDLAVEQADGTVMHQWPLTAAALVPLTWGDLAIGPLYPGTVQAGSAFLDGREGYLVVPYAAGLNPSEITVEAWVKIVDGDCGTLLGNGRDVSYWLAFCKMIQFGHGNADAVDFGQQPLNGGWHHVAVTMDAADGIRIFYLDGQVDAQFGWEPAQEVDPGGVVDIAQLGASDRMLRIGSDRNAPVEVDRLQSYVSELRIWNRVRTAQEINADAFLRLTGTEAGLVGLWPFTNGLQDIAGGHDAGLVGNASLAREGPNVNSFPSIPPPPPYDYPLPGPIAAWNALVPATPGGITIDGMCRPAEYPDESKVVLEPDRNLSMHLLLAPDALYLCTNIIWGGPGLASAVTLWINRDGRGGTVPGPADLRLNLRPDGTLEAGTGDGRDYTGPVPGLFASGIITDTRLALQEDMYPVNSPWWAGELRLPLETLRPFSPGKSLRFALSFEGTVAAGALANQPDVIQVRGSWPAAFDPFVPDTWGQAATQVPSLYLPLIFQQSSGNTTAGLTDPPLLSSPQPESSGVILVNPDQAAALRLKSNSASAGWPHNPPTASNFYNHCSTDAEDMVSYAFDSQSKWPYVDGQNFPFVQAEGVLDSLEISKEDSPFIHDSHDLDMKATVRYEDRWLVLNGEPSLVLETESGPFDSRGIPVPGDHVTVGGRWIFDCGHDPKTEIHPVPIFESDRLVTLPDGIGIPGNQKEVRLVHVWINSHPGGFYFNLSGPFTFNVDLPPGSYAGNKLLYLRVVQGQASQVALTGLSNTDAEITITPSGSAGEFYELVLGYLDTPFLVSAANLAYTVTIDKIWIYDDHDAGAPDCGPWDNLSDCGEWTMFVALNGSWRKVFVNKTVWDEHDHSDYVINQNIPVFGSDLHLRVIGYEDDDPFKGDAITHGEWNLGSLASLCCGVQQSAWHNDWRIFYTVQSSYNGLTALPPADFLYWGLRLANEPNDPVRDDLGTLPVPGQGAPAYIKQKNAYITQNPLVNNGVNVLSQDVDRYKFTLNDFADISLVVPFGVQLNLDQTFPWSYAGHVPQILQDLGVYKSAWINVHGDTLAATDKFYDLKIYVNWRPMPLDWGEGMDTLDPNGIGGRLVDLVTPDPNAQVTGETIFKMATRILTKDWAWQHVAGDIDYYDVWIPPVQNPPPLYIPTPCDTPGGLKVEAYDMHLQVLDQSGAIVTEADNAVKLTGLNGQFPSGHAYIRVSSITGQRGAYRLRAEWRDRHLYTIDDCDTLLSIMASIANFGYQIPSLETLIYPYPFPGPDPEPIIDNMTLFALGGYELVSLEQGDTIDAIISSSAGQPVIARLYDRDGVLLGVGAALGEGDINTRVADGHVPQSHLTVGRLSVGAYYLQIVPAFGASQIGALPVDVGFNAPAASP